MRRRLGVEMRATRKRSERRKSLESLNMSEGLS
jgi:hypothetical protein